MVTPASVCAVGVLYAFRKERKSVAFPVAAAAFCVAVRLSGLTTSTCSFSQLVIFERPKVWKPV
jgi:hypothetical protein